MQKSRQIGNWEVDTFLLMGLALLVCDSTLGFFKGLLKVVYLGGRTWEGDFDSAKE